MMHLRRAAFMKFRLPIVALLVLSGCPAPASAPPAPPPVDPVPTTEPSTEHTPPPAASRPALARGTRTVLAEKKTDDSWARMIVAGGRVWALTDVNKWTSGPMYVPASRLWSVPIGGGELTRHFDLEGLASLAADDASLYVAVTRDLSAMGTSRAKAPTGRIVRVPLGGGSPVDVATKIDPSVFALDGDTFWFDGSKMPKDGSKSPAPSGVKGPLAFAFDEDFVYFTTGKGSDGPKPEGKNGRVLRLPKKGGAPTVLASGLPDEPAGLAVDGTHVYVSAVTWTAAAEHAGIVARVPKQGGDLEVLAKDEPALRGLWLGGDDVYVRSGRAGRPGAVLRVSKTGGPVEKVVTDTTLVQATTDATSIYWSSDGTFRSDPFERLTPAVLVRVVK